MKEVKKIIEKTRKIRGIDHMNSNIKVINKRTSKNMLAQEFRNQAIYETSDQVEMLTEYDPNIVKYLFDELQETKVDEDDTIRKAILEFEKRKLDHRYFCMIE